MHFYTWYINIQNDWCGHKPKNTGSHQKLEQARDGFLPSSLKGAQNRGYFDFGPVVLISDFWPLEQCETKILLF